MSKQQYTDDELEQMALRGEPIAQYVPGTYAYALREFHDAVNNMQQDIEAILNAPWYVKVWWRLQTWGMRLRDLLNAKDVE